MRNSQLVTRLYSQIEELLLRIQDLEAENAKLREGANYYEGLAELFDKCAESDADEIDRLNAENVLLRGKLSTIEDILEGRDHV